MVTKNLYFTIRWRIATCLMFWLWCFHTLVGTLSWQEIQAKCKWKCSTVWPWKRLKDNWQGAIHYKDALSIQFSNFSCMFLNPNMNYNCSNLLDTRNLKEQVKKAFYYHKFVLTFQRLNVWIKCTSDPKNFEITRTIYSNSDRSEQFLVTESFLTCSWRFLISNKLEQL